ncbi:MAG TPA: ATP-binding protein, partial [Gemmataceae bacterium]|nr:ATP-binding protein [Gemmataceae bacterium]
PAISSCRLYGQLRKAYEQLQLTQHQLAQSEKMRALGELAGGMAHDFNNALCGVLGFLELVLLDRELVPASRKNLEAARTCALDAAQTVRRVQDFSRWRRNELAVQRVDLNGLVRETVELTRPRWENYARGKGVLIEVVVETVTEAPISGCPAELREVLTNLVFNAVDAMPRGGTLTVRTWSAGSYAFLSVGDTGVGISEAVRHRLFEPFFTTKGERGNGLGLSVTFGIVQRHGGEITVESEVGRGTTFTIRLPAGVEEVVRVVPAPAPGAGVWTAEPLAGKMPAPRSLRILIVEDEVTVRQFLGMGLSRLGHRPVLTANAREGLAAFEQEAFDVVLTDLGLPGVSGEEVARQVTKRSPNMPVILLTGWADQIVEERGSLEGVKCILGKPVTLDTLNATLASVCPG